MKFVNLIDSKFKQFENKFEQYIYEPNHVELEKKKSEDKSKDSDLETEASDKIFDQESEESEEQFCDIIEEFLKDES